MPAPPPFHNTTSRQFFFQAALLDPSLIHIGVGSWWGPLAELISTINLNVRLDFAGGPGSTAVG